MEPKNLWARCNFNDPWRIINCLSEVVEYCGADVKNTSQLMEIASTTIVKVIFNEPATIVFWMDGTKTVVKAHNEPFDKEKGLAMAVTKKFFGNEGNYYNKIKKWLE